MSAVLLLLLVVVVYVVVALHIEEFDRLARPLLS